MRMALLLLIKSVEQQIILKKKNGNRFLQIKAILMTSEANI